MRTFARGTTPCLEEIETLNKVAPVSRQLRDGTALRIEGQCDLLRTFRARDCDFVCLVLALSPETRPTHLTQQQQRLDHRKDIVDKSLLRLRECHRRRRRPPVYHKMPSQECSDQSFRIRMCKVPHPQPPNTRPRQPCFGEQSHDPEVPIHGAVVRIN